MVRENNYPPRQRLGPLIRSVHRILEGPEKKLKKEADRTDSENSETVSKEWGTGEKKDRHPANLNRNKPQPYKSAPEDASQLPDLSKVPRRKNSDNNNSQWNRWVVIAELRQ